MADLTFVSLFSGIDGLGLGLERAGWTCIGQVEQDPYCRTVLEHHWPEVPKHDDVRTAATWWLERGSPAVDMVAGGPPCQPFSQAGLQLGIGDPRWGWPWMRDFVRAARPRFVLVENVRGLLTDHPDAFGTILADLSGLGFDAEWSVVSACSLGAPHMRRRLFIVAYPAGQGLPRLHGSEAGGSSGPAAGPVRRDWPSEPDVARVAYGIPRRLVIDPLRAMGNTVVPAVGEHVGRLIAGMAVAA